MKSFKEIKIKIDQNSLKRKLIDYADDSPDDTEEKKKETKLCKISENIGQLNGVDNLEVKKEDREKSNSVNDVVKKKKNEDLSRKRSSSKSSVNKKRKKNEDPCKKKSETKKKEESRKKKSNSKCNEDDLNNEFKHDEKSKKTKKEAKNQDHKKANRSVSIDGSNKSSERNSSSDSCSSSCDCSCSDGECCSCSDSSTTSLNLINKKEAIESSSNKLKLDNKSSNPNETIKTFEQLNLSNDFLRGIYKLGIFEPNRLQRIVLPRLKENKSEHFLLQSRLCDGKKTAFLISNLSRVKTDLQKPQVLILAPTTELIYRIYEIAKSMSKYSNITIKFLCRDNQNEYSHSEIDQHVIISTIGIVKYLLSQRSIDLKSIKFCVFDEFDILTSIQENYNCLKAIINYLSNSNATVQYQCYSTFFGDEPFYLMRKLFLNKFEHIDLLKDDLGLRNILQFKVDCLKSEKFVALKNILSYSIFTKIVIYVSGKNIASEVERKLISNGYQALLLTSESPLEVRLHIIKNFTKSDNKILIINYPQSHGFDLGIDLSMIINYDLPFRDGRFVYEYYHKVCNTGRANRPGFVVNLLDRKTFNVSKKLENEIKVKFIGLDCFKPFEENDRKI